MKKSNSAFFLIVILLTACADTASEKKVIPKGADASKTAAIVKGAQKPIPEQHKRDTIQIEDLIGQYITKYKSTEGYDTLVHGTYESIYVSPPYTLEIVDTISLNDFEKIRKSYASNSRPSSFTRRADQSGFSIVTADYVVSFEASNTDVVTSDTHYYTDVIKIENLNAIAFTKVRGSGGSGTGTNWIIDSLTSNIDRVDGYYENFDHISLSKDRHKLICSASNQGGKRGAAIKIMDVNWEEGEYQLRYVLDFKTDKWSVGECYMMDESRIAVSAYNSFGCHYRATVDSNYEINYPDTVDCNPVHLVLELKKTVVN